jgi:hypothetical protein
MDIKRKLLIAGFAVLPALGVGGIAYASTPTSSAPTTATTPAAPGEAAGTEAPDAAAPGDTAPETAAPGVQSDGPGGHQDPAGANVDHQFGGQE